MSLSAGPIFSAISRAKDELHDDKEYLALARKMDQDAGDDEKKQVAAQKCLEIAAVYERYERAKAEHMTPMATKAPAMSSRPM